MANWDLNPLLTLLAYRAKEKASLSITVRSGQLLAYMEPTVPDGRQVAVVCNSYYARPYHDGWTRRQRGPRETPYIWFEPWTADPRLRDAPVPTTSAEQLRKLTRAEFNAGVANGTIRFSYEGYSIDGQRFFDNSVGMIGFGDENAPTVMASAHEFVIAELGDLAHATAELVL